MKSCCENKSEALAELRTRQSGVLKTVLVINATMFVIEMASGILSKSTSLMADSLDMLGDSFVYGFSLFVLAKSDRWRAGAALLKGSIMMAFGLGVLVQACLKAISDVLPRAEAISGVGLLALAANAMCLLLLFRHREDDINMRSTWICSRNDIVANIGVITAGILVALTGTKWPDIAVGMIIAALFLRSSIPVLRDSVKALGPLKVLG